MKLPSFVLQKQFLPVSTDRTKENLFSSTHDRDSETPSSCALTAVAPTVRFKAFEILATPIFFFASAFSSRTSDAVQARLTIFFLAISVPFLRTGFYHGESN
jgi:hypothetical protein